MAIEPGFDLNPAMAVVAKARLLPQCEIASVAPLLADILKKAARAKSAPDVRDSLRIWFAADAAATVRRIERAIYVLLVSAAAPTERRWGPFRNYRASPPFFTLPCFAPCARCSIGSKAQTPPG